MISGAMGTPEQKQPNLPRVTIGLPVFNGERFVNRAIESIRGQTLVDFELIVADNASTDGTLAICERHAAEDSRIRIVTSTHNRGAAWNFNRIVPLAGAAQFKWAAHDDVLAPDFLDRCVPVLENDPSVVLCYPKAVDVDAQDRIIAPIHSVKYAEHADPVVRVREALSFDTSCVETFGVIRTSVLRQTGMIGAYTSSDRTLLLELAVRGRFCEIDDELLLRRQHEDRSVRVTGRDRNSWFDPSRGSVRTLPRWRLLVEIVRVVWTAPATTIERIRMSISAARWGAKRWRRLGRELAVWLAQTARDSYAAISRRLPSNNAQRADWSS